MEENDQSGTFKENNSVMADGSSAEGFLPKFFLDEPNSLSSTSDEISENGKKIQQEQDCVLEENNMNLDSISPPVYEEPVEVDAASPVREIRNAVDRSFDKERQTTEVTSTTGITLQEFREDESNFIESDNKFMPLY